MPWGAIALRLFGGLALFLFGLDVLTAGLKAAAGPQLRPLVSRATRSRPRAVFTGAFITALIQSSSVTTVLVVGFISGGLMTLPQSVGIIMGANIGTTVTAQVVAFKVALYGLGMIAIGFALPLLVRHEKAKHVGSVLMGLGMIFFGMELMGEATGPLREHQTVVEVVRQTATPYIGLIVGALLTALLQSSSAVTGVVIALASEGFISLPAGIALALGANVGTCVTALIAALGKPRAAVQAAVVHVLFNVIGVILWFGFIDQLALLSTSLSPSAPELDGMARLAAETPRQIANAHTIFNVSNTLILIWFTTPLAWLADRLIPMKVGRAPERVQPKYLDEILLMTPSLALDRVRMELAHMAGHVIQMMRRVFPAVGRATATELRAIARMDDDVDSLHEAIIKYLRELSVRHLSERDSALMADEVELANYIENIGDTIESNLVPIGIERAERGLTISPTTLEAMGALQDLVLHATERSVVAMASSDKDVAREVIALKPQVNRLAAKAHRQVAGRLVANEPHRVATFRIESDLIEMTKRLYYFAKRMARVVADANGDETPPEPTV